jgi:hypothetical protein
MERPILFLFSRREFPREGTAEDLAKLAIARFTADFVVPLGLEGSRCTHVAFVTNDAEVVDLAPPGEGFALRKWLRDFVASVPVGAHLREALRLAVEMAATDMGLYGEGRSGLRASNEGARRAASASREELIRDILLEVPDRLSRLYKDAVGQPKKPGPLGDDWDSNSARKHLAAQFEEFCGSVVPAFTFHANVARCRCFDMRIDPMVREDEDQLMVLLVDLAAEQEAS